MSWYNDRQPHAMCARGIKTKEHKVLKNKVLKNKVLKNKITKYPSSKEFANIAISFAYNLIESGKIKDILFNQVKIVGLYDREIIDEVNDKGQVLNGKVFFRVKMKNSKELPICVSLDYGKWDLDTDISRK